MSETAAHTFRLLLSDARAVEDYEFSDSLYEAGFDDVTFAMRAGVPYAEVTREAPVFEQLVLETIDALESVGEGLLVLRVEPDELVTASRIAKRIGRTRQSVNLLISGERGGGGFPAPVTFIDAQTRVWRWTEVGEWLSEHIDEEAIALPSALHGEFLAALNGALAARVHLRRYREGGGSAEHTRRVTSLLVPKAQPQRTTFAKTVDFYMFDEDNDVRRRPVEADGLLSLGCRLAERVRARDSDATQVDPLLRALSAYDAAVLLYTHRRDAAAHRQGFVAFHCAAGLAGLRDETRRESEVSSWVQRGKRSPRESENLLGLCRYGGDCELSIEEGKLAFVPYLQRESEALESLLMASHLQSQQANSWRRAISLLKHGHGGGEWPELGLRETVGRSHVVSLAYVSFALSQAISVFDAELLAADERHLLKELAEHAECELAHSH